ncbi:hypothetical protein DTO012A7_5594 [Penicillium roqueforti]|nr:hypothetical protein CBS147330_3233 [Penicillium roqueforti]KAI3230692.1 hypothetical protein DTO012A7_5594 [Penicillium roqueforti]
MCIARGVAHRHHDDYPFNLRPIEEDDLFQYQRYRWLSGEPEKLGMRYRRFNLQALLNASAKPGGDARTTCVKLLKCVKGQFNKAFLFNFTVFSSAIAGISASPYPDDQMKEEKMLLEHYYDVTKTNDPIRRQLLNDPLHELK